MATLRRALIVSTATLALAGAAAGTASASTTGAFLTLDKEIVRAGEQVRVLAGCGVEGLNLVGSTAFAPTGQDGPYTGNGGVAVFAVRSSALSWGTATVRADAAPGVYQVSERCGGGHAGSRELTVVG
ncbi:hypothetical protein [Amycolatopsis albispora]|uniref:Uncharacterized protein n=1 Tax=Amycolatopsis albispora TaxID=1804986 RepID=A0A344LFR7_9PSEU|nr:hypothetical protein [Amycolatopsis albispora]AXB46891.1 hypothetical protein A4R43_34260 [Amycolatopsis albispora]